MSIPTLRSNFKSYEPINHNKYRPKNSGFCKNNENYDYLPNNIMQIKIFSNCEFLEPFVKKSSVISRFAFMIIAPTLLWIMILTLVQLH